MCLGPLEKDVSIWFTSPFEYKALKVLLIALKD